MSSFLTTMANVFTLSSAADARRAKILALEAKSDAELANMHLKRQDIPAYVFRDVMFL